MHSGFLDEEVCLSLCSWRACAEHMQGTGWWYGWSVVGYGAAWRLSRVSRSSVGDGGYA